MTRATYESRQDFAVKMAAIAKPFNGGFRILGRTLASENQRFFEGMIHDAMNYRSHTVNTD